MKALVNRVMEDGRREKVLVEDWPAPAAPQRRQVLTKTLYSGVTNGSERNILIRGNYAPPDNALPAPWGYQNVGEVVATGPDVRNLKTGDVLFMSCDHLAFCVVDEEGLLVKLPIEIDPKEAALFGMASVAMRTVRHAELKVGDRLLVVGAGFIGQVCAQIAYLQGADVTICDLDARRLEMARGIGTVHLAFESSDDGWRKSAPDGAFDAVIDVAGVPGMEDRLVLAVKPRGTVIFIAGRTKVDYTFNIGQGREVSIKQNSHFDRSDLEYLCRLVALGAIRFGPLLQDVVPVVDAKGIFDRLRDQPGTLLGTVFDWR
jgi:2-desacetyl-2-hydroxyethyl bacteriochlorophyllide A dehydrogenase